MSEPLAIIPSFVREPQDLEILRTAIASLRETEPELDLLVVDDGSPGVQLVDELASDTSRFQFELHRSRENQGFSRTVNVGLRRALQEKRDAILVNADIEFIDSGWVSRFQSQEKPNGQPADVVGARLLFPNGLIQHGGIYFCSPGDEPVLTARDGYVPIAQLDPEIHGLVSYDRKNHKIFRCPSTAGNRVPGSGKRQNGYGFEVGSRHYEGDILGVETSNGLARLTPNHKLTVNWTEGALAKWAVYVMRRGRDWRVGHTKMAHGGSAGGRGWAFGPRLRLDQQKADALWLVRICDSKHEAMELESLLAWEHGVPTLQFEASGAGLPRERLDYIWACLSVERGAAALLSRFERDVNAPLLVSRRLDGRRRAPVGPSRRYEISAANLMPDAMTVPADAGGQHPRMEAFGLSREKFSGDVYSLEVLPHRHYISGGVVVHNSLLTRTFDHRFKFGPADLPEAQRACVCPVTGALQYIRFETLDTVGVYDDRFRMGWEDVDYALRVFLAGGMCVYQPTVRAYHHESIFRGRPSEKVQAWQQESYALLMEKYKETNFAQFVPSL